MRGVKGKTSGFDIVSVSIVYPKSNFRRKAPNEIQNRFVCEGCERKSIENRVHENQHQLLLL